jgi:PDZ domain-containing protein
VTVPGPPPSSTPLPGYLGLTKRSFGLDWKSVLEHGPCVWVTPYSPAWKAGLRSGDFIISINGSDYDNFDAARKMAGETFRVIVWRPRVGKLTVFGQLAAARKPRPTPSWLSHSLTLAGRAVTGRERSSFVQGFISKHPRLKAIDTRLLTLLLNYEGPKGIIPRRGRLAKDLGCSLSTLDRSMRRCCHEGVLVVESGKSRRTSNKYSVTWPQNHLRSQADNEG